MDYLYANTIKNEIEILRFSLQGRIKGVARRAPYHACGGKKEFLLLADTGMHVIVC